MLLQITSSFVSDKSQLELTANQIKFQFIPDFNNTFDPFKEAIQKTQQVVSV